MPSLRRPILAPVLVACACALAAPPGWAQAKTKSLGSGKAGGPLLSRAELRECLAGQDRLQARRAETVKLQEQLAHDKAEIDRQGDALRDRLAALDRTSQEQVDQYNAQAGERDRLIDAYEARSATFNTEAQALNAQADAWKKRCENRRYDENDELLIKAGK